ncbi:hypothetical protein H2204_011953 [Knufia peltigerae]|uniref:Uncharacterized protein n=1 Tax=Knufia peltigerae TaxID=1002370 RepID=A0AA38XTM8_9EURO|nr:hypothetical protein H2204_011953 [Knufia peltigerae]
MSAVYEYTGPVDCGVVPDKTQCKGKSVIVTGGANGMGEAYVREFVKNGAFVTFCDVNEERGKAIETELSPERTCFVKCDISSWDDQVRLFEAAVTKSPSKTVDIVISNAGVGRGAGDPMMALEGTTTVLISGQSIILISMSEDPFSKPTKPSMHIIDINLVGNMYTFKLAIHYFRRGEQTPDRDRCFIFIGSIAGICDNLGSWEYSTSKWGLRGLMRTARRNAPHQGIRVAYVAPAWIRTAIQTQETLDRLAKNGVEFATIDSAVKCVMRVSCDKSINGHSFVICSESVSKHGFIDAEEDDRTDENHWLQKIQRTVFRARGDAWP